MIEAFGTKPVPVRIRMMSGTVPTADTLEALKMPLVDKVNEDLDTRT